ncbi:ArsR/SmtB family transcription factor [Ornithinibacillus scapharcae]|uniref:ArsR/SmtB family transcription factor n=1 Tax=Ornithinibacillus scapharcae TaxID=1147159 RepID=UPI000225B8E4|nr:metalloregulator ArsR/SmtB family transcription factor [Ornithinibacillus scapharcae]
MKDTDVMMNQAAVVLKLLGDKTRLTMLKILDVHDCCVCEFVEVFTMSQPSISQHLRKLKDVGLIQEERKGQWIFYSMNKNSVHYTLIRPLLEQLPNQSYKIKELERSGKRILCC